MTMLVSTTLAADNILCAACAIARIIAASRVIITFDFMVGIVSNSGTEAQYRPVSMVSSTEGACREARQACLFPEITIFTCQSRLFVKIINLAAIDVASLAIGCLGAGTVSSQIRSSYQTCQHHL